MSILTIIIVGLIVGAVARLLVPGPDPMGFLGTLAVGVGGSFLGWWAGHSLVGDQVTLHPWLWSIGGAVVLVLLYRSLARRRTFYRRYW
jgi:uncharacterized membrane protein YeaQ/YmgE (transglycosylase-associated protein family)